MHKLVVIVLMQGAEQFSQTLSQVASNANLDRIGRQRGLQTFVNKNPSQGRDVSPITMAATVEAILGAVYLDSNLREGWRSDADFRSNTPGLPICRGLNRRLGTWRLAKQDMFINTSLKFRQSSASLSHYDTTSVRSLYKADSCRHSDLEMNNR